jgi:hypothetical protein
LNIAMAGRLGYRAAYRHQARVPLAIVTMERPFREFDGSFMNPPPDQSRSDRLG